MNGEIMKRIPFKCKHGHVTIKEFKNSEEKPSVIECQTCKDNIENKILFNDGGSRPWMASYYTWIEKRNKTDRNYKPTIAMRF